MTFCISSKAEAYPTFTHLDYKFIFDSHDAPTGQFLAKLRNWVKNGLKRGTADCTGTVWLPARLTDFWHCHFPGWKFGTVRRIVAKLIAEGEIKFKDVFSKAGIRKRFYAFSDQAKYVQVVSQNQPVLQNTQELFTDDASCRFLHLPSTITDQEIEKKEKINTEDETVEKSGKRIVDNFKPDPTPPPNRVELPNKEKTAFEDKSPALNIKFAKSDIGITPSIPMEIEDYVQLTPVQSMPPADLERFVGLKQTVHGVTVDDLKLGFLWVEHTRTRARLTFASPEYYAMLICQARQFVDIDSPTMAFIFHFFSSRKKNFLYKFIITPKCLLTQWKSGQTVMEAMIDELHSSKEGQQIEQRMRAMTADYTKPI